MHAAGPDLLKVLVTLLQAISDKEKSFLVELERMTPQQVYERALGEAKRIVSPLAAIYFERPRGIRDVPDAGRPVRRY